MERLILERGSPKQAETAVQFVLQNLNANGDLQEWDSGLARPMPVLPDAIKAPPVMREAQTEVQVIVRGRVLRVSVTYYSCN